MCRSLKCERTSKGRGSHERECNVTSDALIALTHLWRRGMAACGALRGAAAREGGRAIRCGADGDIQASGGKMSHWCPTDTKDTARKVSKLVSHESFIG